MSGLGTLCHLQEFSHNPLNPGPKSFCRVGRVSSLRAILLHFLPAGFPSQWDWPESGPSHKIATKSGSYTRKLTPPRHPPTSYSRRFVAIRILPTIGSLSIRF